KDALSNRFFESLDDLNTAIDTALDRLSIPNVSSYF
ncbi:IS630 family transposase, partial [Halobium palmae]